MEHTPRSSSPIRCPASPARSAGGWVGDADCAGPPRPAERPHGEPAIDLVGVRLGWPLGDRPPPKGARCSPPLSCCPSAATIPRYRCQRGSLVLPARRNNADANLSTVDLAAPRSRLAIARLTGEKHRRNRSGTLGAGHSAGTAVPDLSLIGLCTLLGRARACAPVRASFSYTDRDSACRWGVENPASPTVQSTLPISIPVLPAGIGAEFRSPAAEISLHFPSARRQAARDGPQQAGTPASRPRAGSSWCSTHRFAATSGPASRT